MTTAQHAQAIDEAYQTYCNLFYSNAPLKEQQAAFQRYMEARQAYEQSR